MLLYGVLRGFLAVLAVVTSKKKQMMAAAVKQCLQIINNVHTHTQTCTPPHLHAYNYTQRMHPQRENDYVLLDYKRQRKKGHPKEV